VEFYDVRKLTFLDKLYLKLKQPILHAWTPRENVRLLTKYLSKSLYSDYYIHMEDNEEVILESQFDLPFTSIQKLSVNEIEKKLRKDLIHPLYYKEFINNASGVTCIFKTLEEFVPDNIPKLTFWPACENEFYDMPLHPKQDNKCKLGLDIDTIIICYTGNMHLNNVYDITLLYKAIGILNEKGDKVILVRTGSNTCAFSEDVSYIVKNYVKEFGSCSAEDIRNFISISDIIVQPGKENNFNNYRFPSKLPMSLASGKPVLLPKANIGKFLEDGFNCIHLNNDSLIELVEKLKILINNRDLRFKIGLEGRKFAKVYFNWERASKNILTFYKETRPSIFEKFKKQK
jgi:glycosyltransferase involved in cell wall biosynthesis